MNMQVKFRLHKILIQRLVIAPPYMECKFISNSHMGSLLLTQCTIHSCSCHKLLWIIDQVMMPFREQTQHQPRFTILGILRFKTTWHESGGDRFKILNNGFKFSLFP